MHLGTECGDADHEIGHLVEAHDLQRGHLHRPGDAIRTIARRGRHHIPRHDVTGGRPLEPGFTAFLMKPLVHSQRVSALQRPAAVLHRDGDRRTHRPIGIRRHVVLDPIRPHRRIRNPPPVDRVVSVGRSPEDSTLGAWHKVEGPLAFTGTRRIQKGRRREGITRHREDAIGRAVCIDERRQLQAEIGIARNRIGDLVGHHVDQICDNVRLRVPVRCGGHDEARLHRGELETEESIAGVADLRFVEVRSGHLYRHLEIRRPVPSDDMGRIHMGGNPLVARRRGDGERARGGRHGQGCDQRNERGLISFVLRGPHGGLPPGVALRADCGARSPSSNDG